LRRGRRQYGDAALAVGVEVFGVVFPPGFCAKPSMARSGERRSWDTEWVNSSKSRPWRHPVGRRVPPGRGQVHRVALFRAAADSFTHTLLLVPAATISRGRFGSQSASCALAGLQSTYCLLQREFVEFSAMRKILYVSGALAVCGLAGLVSQSLAEDKPGYTDTPMLPSGKWHVHDPNRPVPAVVPAGETFSLSAAPPADAMCFSMAPTFLIGRTTRAASQSGLFMAITWNASPRADTSIARRNSAISTARRMGRADQNIVGKSQDRGNSGRFSHREFMKSRCWITTTIPPIRTANAALFTGSPPPLVNRLQNPGRLAELRHRFSSRPLG